MSEEPQLPYQLFNLIKAHEKDLLKQWMENQLSSLVYRKDLIGETELYQQSQEFLQLFQKATQEADLSDINKPEWNEVQQFLKKLSYTRTQQGFNASETATFIFSFKEPLIQKLREVLKQNYEALFTAIRSVTTLIDKLGLYTIEVYQVSREDIIQRQQEEMLELSTPVIKIWDGILALPMIGTLDSSRTQVVMENLLQKIVETGCEIAIIDITGVPNVDTLVAQHLLKTVTAAKLMGAECIISGIRPQIAQTIVHLGVSLTGVITKATLADAFILALKRIGQGITPLIASKLSS